MKAFVFIFLLVFVAIVLWRNVAKRKKDRRLIAFGIKESLIAGAIAITVAVVLFFTLFYNTVRVI